LTEWRGTSRRYVIASEISIAISKSVKIPIFYHLYLHIPILLSADTKKPGGAAKEIETYLVV